MGGHRWARVLAGAVVVLALAEGAARAVTDDVLALCGLMASTAGQFMEARQDGIPRDALDDIVASSKDPQVSEFMNWVIDAAYSVEVFDSPSSVSKVVTEFQTKVRFQCYAQDWR